MNNVGIVFPYWCYNITQTLLFRGSSFSVCWCMSLIALLILSTASIVSPLCPAVTAPATSSIIGSYSNEIKQVLRYLHSAVYTTQFYLSMFNLSLLWYIIQTHISVSGWATRKIRNWLYGQNQKCWSKPCINTILCIRANHSWMVVVVNSPSKSE